MKIIGIDYESGKCTDIDITTDGKDRIKFIPVNDDFEAVLTCAIRYSLGRQTYMPELVINFINPLLSQLSDKTLYCMSKDISEANSYGDEYIDRPKWNWFLNNIKAEIEDREKG